MKSARVVGVVVSGATMLLACAGKIAPAGTDPAAGDDGGGTVVYVDGGPYSGYETGIPVGPWDASGPYGGSCPVAVTSMDIAEVSPPRDNTQGSCTDAELAKVTGMFADIVKAVSPTCASCLFSESNDMTNTQFFVWADAMHVNISLDNYGACMGSPLSGGSAVCGRAAEEIESCLEAACPRDASGSTTCTDITDQDCITAAIAGDCKQYDDKQTTSCGGATALKAIFTRCFDSQGSPDPGIKLLCGGASGADAGGG